MKLKAKNMDMDAAEMIAFMNPQDASVLGVRENDRIRIETSRGDAVMVLTISETYAKKGEIYIIDDVMEKLKISEGEEIDVYYSVNPESVRSIRKKMDKEKLNREEIYSIVEDIAESKLCKIEVSAWLTALYINGMDIEEIAAFTQAMVDTGDRVQFERTPVFDFHSMGGVPGNKVTPIVVSIVAAAGMMIPKTSSRAISSACGTSDFVETFCNVELDAQTLKRISEEVGGVLAWGGSMNLAPVDDMVIRIEHPLGINPRAQMLASIMSKKVAIGATHLVVDIPTGSGTKVPTIEVARAYARDFMDLGEALNIHVECAITYADQPVGNAVGPILEAKECISILEGAKHPSSVIEKACDLAGIILEMGGYNNGADYARQILDSGQALKKFREIVAAQGGSPTVSANDLIPGKFTVEIRSNTAGYVHSIKNKDIVSIAKAAGAPSDKGAGILLNRKKGQRVEKGDLLFTIYADNEAKLNRARELAIKYVPFEIEGMLIKRVTATKAR
ncbi:MAG: AMP phosphorylase [Candidatus Methanomethylophilaceae archaeon]|nr:AMP phosphorylase [Candidatus Methanomethylophilaceae archaeon]